MGKVHHKTKAYISSIIDAPAKDRPFFVMLPDLPAEPPALSGGTREAALSAIKARSNVRSRRFVPSKAELRRREERARRESEFAHLLSKLPPVPVREPVPVPPPLIVRKDRVRVKSRSYVDIRMLVYAQGRRCGICGLTMPVPGVGILADPMSRATVDHVIPISKGGGNVGNLIAAHERCNGRKADRLPTGCERIWLAAVNARLTPSSQNGS